jgi:hypothetical protein
MQTLCVSEATPAARRGAAQASTRPPPRRTHSPTGTGRLHRSHSF